MSGSASEDGLSDLAVAGDPREVVLGPVVLTDVELAVLEAAHRRLLGQPEHGAPPEEQAGTAGAEREARRSLVARGLLGEDGELPEDDDVALLLGTVLDVRLAAERVLVVERILTGAGSGQGGSLGSGRRGGSDDLRVRRGTRLVHLVRSGACVEDLLVNGSHHLYLLLERDEVVPWVTRVTVPPDAVAATGPTLAVHPGRPDEIPKVLGHPTVLVELSVLAPTAEASDAVRRRSAARPHHLLALGPSGCWVCEVDPRTPLPESVVFTPVHPGWVGEWVRSALDEGRAAGRREAGDGQGTMSG